jgi:transposase-like protein
MEQMSEGEYLMHGGAHCPNCDSENIEGHGIKDFDADWCSAGVTCKSCGATWDDIFTLSGYDNLVLTA